MKALMIVDLHDDFPFESAKADIRIRANDKVIYRKHKKVRRMPNKRLVSYHDDLFGDVEKNFTNIGWNACIEELEK